MTSFDAFGGFWFTDIGKPVGRAVERGALCYAAADGRSLKRVIDGPRVNGIGLSPDGSSLYAAITQEALVVVFDVPSPGTLSPEGLPAGRWRNSPHGLAGYGAECLSVA